MLLNRLGCKAKLLPRLLPCIPDGIGLFMDLFAGTLSVSFAMLGRARYIVANDADAEVANLYRVWKEQPEDLADALETLPQHESLLSWTPPDGDAVLRAAMFVFRSNFSFLSKGDTLKFGAENPRQNALRAIRDGFAAINRIQFMAADFRDALRKLAFRHAKDRERAFIYADPPYVGTATNNYAGFAETDAEELFDLLTASGFRFALSEFDTPEMLDLAARHALRVVDIGERRNINNRRREILVTNYAPLQPALSF